MEEPTQHNDVIFSTPQEEQVNKPRDVIFDQNLVSDRIMQLDPDTTDPNKAAGYSEAYLPNFDPNGNVYFNKELNDKERLKAVQSVISPEEKEAEISRYIEDNLLLSTRDDARLRALAITDVMNLVPSEFGDLTQGVSTIASGALGALKYFEDTGLYLRNLAFDKLYDKKTWGGKEYYVDENGEPFVPVNSGGLETASKTLGTQELAKDIKKIGESTPSGFDKYPKSMEQYWKDDELGNFGGRLYHSVVQQSPQAIGQTLAAMTGMTAPALMAMGAQSSGGKYLELEDNADVSQGKKIVSATATGAFEMGTELITFGWMKKFFAGKSKEMVKTSMKGFFSSLLALPQEAGGETVNQIAENVTDRMLDIKRSDGTLPVWNDGAIDAGILGALMPVPGVAYDMRAKYVANQAVEAMPVNQFRAQLQQTLAETGENKSIVDMNDNYLRQYLKEQYETLDQNKERTVDEENLYEVLGKFENNQLKAIPELLQLKSQEFEGIYKENMLAGALEDANVGAEKKAEIESVPLEEQATAEEINQIFPSFEESEKTDTQGLRHDDIKNLREAAGMEAIPKREAQALQAVVNNATATQVQKKAESIADEVLADPDGRVVTDTEHVGMIMKVIELQNQTEELENAQRKSKKKGLHKKQIKQLQSSIDTITKATYHGSSMAGRYLNARKIMLNRMDYTYAGIEKKAKEYAEGRKNKELTSKEKVEFQDFADQLATIKEKNEKLQKQYDDVKAELNDKGASDFIAEYADDIANEMKKKKKAKREASWEERQAAIIGNLNKLGQRANDVTGVPLEVGKNIAMLAELYIEKGVTSLPALVKKIQSHTEMSEAQIKESLKKRTRNAKKAQKTAVKKVTKLLEKKAVTEAQALTKLENMKKDISKKIELEKQGIDTRPKVNKKKIDTELAKLRKELADLRKKNKAEKNKDEIAVEKENQIKNRVKILRGALAEQIALEKKGIDTRKKHTKKEVDAQTQALKDSLALERKINKKQAELQEVLTKLKQEIVDIEVNQQRAQKYARDIDAIEQLAAERRIDEAATKFNKLKAEMNTERKIVKYKQALEQDNLDDLLDITSPKRKKDILEKEISDAQLEEFYLKRRVRSKIADLQPQKKWTSASGTVQGLMLSADLGFIFRQGKMITTRHPVIAAKALAYAQKLQLISLKGAEGRKAADKMHDQTLKEVYDDPILSKEIKKAGLTLTDMHGGLTSKEEKFTGAGWIEDHLGYYGKNVIGGSELAHTTGINILRIEAFKKFMTTYPDASNEVKAHYANLINIWTGRGSLGFLERSAQGLTETFLAPRWVASNFQSPFVAFRPSVWTNAELRTEVAKMYSAYMVPRLGILAMAAMAGGEVEWRDATNPDFLKIKVGNTRIDIWGGGLQPGRYMIGNMQAVLRGWEAEASGEKKSPWADFSMSSARYLMYRFNPLLAQGTTGVVGYNVIGQKKGGVTGRLETAFRAITPLSGQMIADFAYDAATTDMEASEIALRVAGMPAEFYGVNVNTYRNDKNKNDDTDF